MSGAAVARAHAVRSAAAGFETPPPAHIVEVPFSHVASARNKRFDFATWCSVRVERTKRQTHLLG